MPFPGKHKALREFSFGVYNDPFMQVKCLHALSMLKKTNEELEEIMQGLVSSLETKRNSGRSILYQTVQTICALSGKTSLRGLAFTQIGRLLSMRDPNVLYSSLSVFARVLYEENEFLARRIRGVKDGKIILESDDGRAGKKTISPRGNIDIFGVVTACIKKFR